MPCLGLLEDADLTGHLWVVKCHVLLQGLANVSPKAPPLLSQQRFPSRLSQIPLQFLAFLPGDLANVIFVVVPRTGIYWPIDFKVRSGAQGVFHQALCSSGLQTLSLSLRGLPGLAAWRDDAWGCSTCEIPGDGVCCVLVCDEVLGGPSLTTGWHSLW